MRHWYFYLVSTILKVEFTSFRANEDLHCQLDFQRRPSHFNGLRTVESLLKWLLFWYLLVLTAPNTHEVSTLWEDMLTLTLLTSAEHYPELMVKVKKSFPTSRLSVNYYYYYYNHCNNYYYCYYSPFSWLTFSEQTANSLLITLTLFPALISY